jgi:hypothetical protein
MSDKVDTSEIESELDDVNRNLRKVLKALEEITSLLRDIGNK